MLNDTAVTDSRSELDSLGSDDFQCFNWVTPAGSIIETTIDKKFWSNELISSFQYCAQKLLDGICAEIGNPTTTVSLYLCSDGQMQELNKRYRDIDKSTNVLSFPVNDMSKNETTYIVPVLIGDIAIAAETVMREATKMKVSASDHLAHLFLHGLLHLFGYDHVDVEMAEDMEAMETKILAKIGIADPYQDAQMEV